MFLRCYVYLSTYLVTRSAVSRLRDESGQASAEYALVLLGAAAVALLVFGWTTKNNKIGDLLDAVIDNLLTKAKAT